MVLSLSRRRKTTQQGIGALTPHNPEEPVAAIALRSLTEDALVELGEAGALTVVTRWGEFEFHDVSEPVREALRRMAMGPVSLANVVDPGGDAAADLQRTLHRLAGSVVHSLGTADGRGLLLSVVPVSAKPVFSADRPPGTQSVRLSRFATLRPAADGMVVESPSALSQVLLVHPVAIRIASSLAAVTTAETVATATGIPAELVADVVAFLLAAGVVLAGDSGGHFPEDEDRELGLWDHDALMFHQRSRTWLPARAPEPARRAVAPLPVVKTGNAGPTFPLPRPDLSAVAEIDPTLTELLESDHRCPEFTEEPITLERLGEFLYRAARVRSVGQAHLQTVRGQDATQRPYYSVGLVYELEIYLSINRCAGLGRGIYHYDPLWHTVTLINDDPADLDAMLDMARVAGGGHRQPSALLTMSARIPRVGRIFGGAGYATTLLHLGALQQVLYLTAKAMGLSAHAIPVDASDRVDRALKLEWPAEVGIGECVLDAR